MIRTRGPRRRAAIALAWGLAGAAGGCVERRYTIRTEPPGALVVVNDEEIGPSPASKSFVYYGDRRVQLFAEGYQPLELVQPIRAPWWDNKLTEFFTENLVPITLRDEREFTYRLVPATPPTTPELLERAEGLRRQAQAPPKPRRGGILGFFGF
jgi:PEGA domain